jgi:L-threonylcarbamoyladenylate synthase
MKTSILKAHPANPDSQVIQEAVTRLKSGKLVAFPTDTVYGIGADVFNEEAVEKIFMAKNRDPDKPLQILISNRDDLQSIAREPSEIMDHLVSEFFPGPLTLVISARDDFPKRVRCGRETIGVRMPANPIALELIESFGAPIAATSANISGFPDPNNAEDVKGYLDGKVSLIIDGGSTPGDIPSTLLDISTRPPVLLRLGKLSVEKINRILERFGLECKT